MVTALPFLRGSCDIVLLLFCSKTILGMSLIGAILVIVAVAGTNKAASSSTSLNTRKLDEETENLHRECYTSSILWSCVMFSYSIYGLQHVIDQQLYSLS